jgi:hypothetical protein
MAHTFAEIIEEVTQLSMEEQEELRYLLARRLTERNRRQIYDNYQSSLEELKANSLGFSADIDELRKTLTHD